MEKKKIIASILGATLMTSPQVNAEENYSLGDVNFNGMVSADDASMVLMEYSRNSTGEKETFTELQKKLADIDKNGKIEATDATMILRYYAYLSTGGELSFEEYLKEGERPVIQTTTSTTSTTTQTTIPTTTVVTTTKNLTEQERRRQEILEKSRRKSYSKYDLLDESIYQSMYAMDYLCDEFRKELYNGYFFETPYGASHGQYETRALILNLNYDYGVNVGLSGKAYDYTDEETYLIYSDALNLAYTQFFYQTTVDFNKYLFDEDLANFFNKVSAEYKEYMNGNREPLENELSNYFENNSVDIDNYAKYFFMRCTQNPYNLNAPEVEEARQMYFDNVAIPTFHKVKDNAIKVITR